MIEQDPEIPLEGMEEDLEAPEEQPAPTEVYFANKPDDELVSDLLERIELHDRYVDDQGVTTRRLKSYDCFYGKSFNSVEGNAQELSAGGSDGRLTQIRVNHYGNVVRHQQNLVMQERPATKLIAVNTNAGAMAKTIRASSILDFIKRKLNIERAYASLVLQALLFDESYLKIDWDTSLGEVVPVVDGSGLTTQRSTGDFRLSIVNPLNVIKDPFLESEAESDWEMIRTWRNRWDLVELYPELREEILTVETKDEWNRLLRWQNTQHTTEIIPVYEFLHKPTAACPLGKRLIFVSKDAVLHTGVMDYPVYPLFRLAPEDLIGTPYGYTLNHDLLGIQEAIDQLYSIIISNQRAFGLANVLVPEGSNLRLQNVLNGINILKYFPQANGAKPEAFTILETPREIFEFLKQLETVMEILSAVNPALRGQPGPSLESGSALAMVVSQATTFMTNTMRAFTHFVEGFETALVKFIQKYVDVIPQKAVIAGESNQYVLEKFTGKDFEGIDSVRAERVSAVANSPAGRQDMAEKMLNAGVIDAAKFLQIVRTGNLDVIGEADVKERILVKRENELLRLGPVPPAVITENHLLHIKEHSADIADADLRVSDPERLARVLDHVNTHIMALATPDPIMQNLLTMLGQTPLMLPPPMPTDQGGPNAEGTPPGTPGQEPGSSAGSAKMPNMPTNPATGQQFDPATGGGVKSLEGA